MRFAVEPGFPEFHQDRAFDPAIHAKYPGTATWSVVKTMLESRGAEVRTADLYAGDPDITDTVLISHCWTPMTADLLARGARGGVLVCWESPVVAWDFHRKLPHLAKHFRYVFGYPGIRRRLPNDARFQPTFLPQPAIDPPVDPWSERRFLAIVNSNIRPDTVGIVPLVQAVAARLFSDRPQIQRPSIRRQLVGFMDRELREELYSERLRLIESLASLPDFDLYGRGWDRIGRERFRASPLVMSRWRGMVEDKHAVLRRYRFVLCVENTAFPGYITEKLTDAFLAGAIPIYLGAPDVESYVPAGTFVHLRDMPSDDALITRLREMTPGEADHMRAAARAFVRSSAFAPFTQEVVGRRIADAALATS